MTDPAPPLLDPVYGRGGITGLVPALFSDLPGERSWLPEPVRAPRDQTVLLVLDGVGWTQLRARAEVAPTLTSMIGGPITSVAPTTTATALCSIVSGLPPARHGIVGYRMRVGEARVLNALRWRTVDGDARETVPPREMQPHEAFLGRPTPVVTRAEFRSTGFTRALGIERLHGWQSPSSIAVEVGALLAAGEPFVYAYYDGVDKIAHAHGFGPHYDAELAFVDRLVGDVAAVLPAGAALVVTADHGQVDVGDRLVILAHDVMDEVALVSGEARFLWLHAREGREAHLLERLRQYERSGVALVRTRAEVVGAGWFGGALAPEVERRLGDVAIVARQPVAFLDPSDTGSAGLRCRHGSLTEDELLVPLVAVGSS